jgi:type I restriction enzyme S subunit
MTPLVETKPFGELATFRNGVNFAASSRGAGTLAVIGVGAFQRNERLSEFDQLERIARPKNLDDDALLRNGDLVFVRSNGNKDLIGRCMILEGVTGPVSHSGFTIRARLTEPDLEPEWIAQYFATGLARKAIRRRGGGTNISNLSQQMLQDLPIPVPSRRYQTNVLSIACGFSETLRQLDSLLSAKRAFKRGLMQQLLTGQNRFRGFRDRAWHEVHLGDVFNERNESNRPDLPLLSVTGDRGLIPRDQLVKRDTSNPDKAKYKRVAVGDIAYNTMRMWQGVSALASLEGIVSPAYTVAIPTERMHGPFAKHLFKFLPVVNLFHRHSQGLVDDTLNLKFDRFAKVKLTIPTDTAEQARIASVLDLCESEIDQLAQLRDLIETQKSALLSKLLSGSLPVPV